ncbi:unnamed protein product [Calicophoron daubneyi]|uniref:Ferritin n=1 Tax=Calicophoron daubneyi TaxID=300641 RepID=A0AAV2TUJ3_CALDB
MQSSRINYPQESEQAINQLIRSYMGASLTYYNLQAACATEEVSMPGFCKYFRMCALRVRKVAESTINWQTVRGGKFQIGEVQSLVPPTNIWQHGIEKILLTAVEVEKNLEHQLHQACQIARGKDDFATAERLEHSYLQNQVLVTRMLVNLYNGLQGSQNAYHYDRTTMFPLYKSIRDVVERRSRNNYKPGYKGYGYESDHSDGTLNTQPHSHISSGIDGFVRSMQL